MSPKTEVLTNWLRRTREDLQACRRLLAGPDPIPNSACFHAQQSAEKALKAFLHWNEHGAPRTHALERLIDECGKLDGEFLGLASAAAGLTPYAVEVRYESSRLILEEEARDALTVAENIVGFVVSRLLDSFDRMIAAEEQVEKAREEQQMSALRAELEALKGEGGKDREAK